MNVDIIYPATPKEGILMPEQTHSANVIEVVTGDEDLSNCDALITANRELTIGVLTADCAPIALSDGERIAIVHAGWRGLAGGIIEHTLSKMDAPIDVYVGPHLRAFTIQKDFCYDAITAKFGEQFLESQEGGYLFHFREAIASRLPSHARFDPRDTKTDLSLPSYRHRQSTDRIITSVRFA